MNKARTLLPLYILLTPSLVFPCSRTANYQPPSMAEGFASAELVFEGEVIASKPDNHAIPGSTKAAFRIVKIWKGDLIAGANIEVHLQQSTCDPLGQSAEPGAHIVIFARPHVKSIRTKNKPTVWSSGFDYGSFELTSSRYPKTENRDTLNIETLERIVRAQVKAGHK